MASFCASRHALSIDIVFIKYRWFFITISLILDFGSKMLYHISTQFYASGPRLAKLKFAKPRLAQPSFAEAGLADPG